MSNIVSVHKDERISYQYVNTAFAELLRNKLTFSEWISIPKKLGLPRLRWTQIQRDFNNTTKLEQYYLSEKMGIPIKKIEGLIQDYAPEAERNYNQRFFRVFDSNLHRAIMETLTARQVLDLPTLLDEGAENAAERMTLTLLNKALGDPTRFTGRHIQVLEELGVEAERALMLDRV